MAARTQLVVEGKIICSGPRRAVQQCPLPLPQAIFPPRDNDARCRLPQRGIQRLHSHSGTSSSPLSAVAMIAVGERKSRSSAARPRCVKSSRGGCGGKKSQASHGGRLRPAESVKRRDKKLIDQILILSKSTRVTESRKKRNIPDG